LSENPLAESKKNFPWWGWVIIAVVAIGAIGALGDDDSDEAADSSSTAVEAAEEAQDTEPIVEEAPAPEPEAEPEVKLTVEDIRESVIPLVFDSTRAGIIEILTDMTIVQSVDLFMYDPAAGTVTLDVTPEYDFEDGVRDDAWEFFRLFAGGFYKAGSDNDGWILEDPRFAPNFRATVSSATYECEGETMRDLAESMLSRADWETTCRVS
jgi:hypothetical protein